jgi:hypothetical protein
MLVPIRRWQEPIAPGRYLDCAEVSVAATEFLLLEPIEVPEGDGWEPAGCTRIHSPGSIPRVRVWLGQVFPWFPLDYTHIVVQKFVREVDLNAQVEWSNFVGSLGR